MFAATAFARHLSHASSRSLGSLRSSTSLGRVLSLPPPYLWLRIGHSFSSAPWDAGPVASILGTARR